MLKAGYGLVRESGRVFLEAAPVGLDPSTLESAIREVPGVRNVRDLHVWEVTSGMPCLSAEIHVDEGIDCHGIRRSVDAMLHERFDIAHSTLQTEHVSSIGEIETDIPIMSVYSSSRLRKPYARGVCAVSAHVKS